MFPVSTLQLLLYNELLWVNPVYRNYMNKIQKIVFGTPNNLPLVYEVIRILNNWLFQSITLCTYDVSKSPKFYFSFELILKLKY